MQQEIPAFGKICYRGGGGGGGCEEIMYVFCMTHELMCSVVG